MNRGMAGHMHLIEPDLGAGATASSAPAVRWPSGRRSRTRLRPGAVAVAFHGEAAMNDGMLMEAYNLAVAWKPARRVRVQGQQVVDHNLLRRRHRRDAGGRARGFGLPVETANGHRVEDVFAAAGRLIERARDG